MIAPLPVLAAPGAAPRRRPAAEEGSPRSLAASALLAVVLHAAGALLLGLMPGHDDTTAPAIARPRATRVRLRIAAPEQPPRADAAPDRSRPRALAPPPPLAPPADAVAPPPPRSPPPPDLPPRNIELSPPPPCATLPPSPADAGRPAVPPPAPPAMETTGDDDVQAHHGPDRYDGSYDLPPTPRRQIRPLYPLSARQRGEEGVVEAEITVNADGRVAATEVVRGSGFPDLDRAALAALKAACFEPARRDGRAVPSRVRMKIIFRLTDD